VAGHRLSFHDAGVAVENGSIFVQKPLKLQNLQKQKLQKPPHPPQTQKLQKPPHPPQTQKLQKPPHPPQTQPVHNSFRTTECA
jgi:hypothetical protein